MLFFRFESDLNPVYMWDIAKFIPRENVKTNGKEEMSANYFNDTHHADPKSDKDGQTHVITEENLATNEEEKEIPTTPFHAAHHADPKSDKDGQSLTTKEEDWIKDPKREMFMANTKKISIQDTVLIKVDAVALSQLHDQLEQLKIINTRLEVFPFAILSYMSQLEELEISSNALKSVPAFASSSLKQLVLRNNEIDTLLPGWVLPNLEALDISKYDRARNSENLPLG